MKTLPVLATSVVLALGLAACGASKSSTVTKSENTADWTQRACLSDKSKNESIAVEKYIEGGYGTTRMIKIARTFDSQSRCEKFIVGEKTLTFDRS